MPKKIIAANWKMNNDEYSSKKLTFDFLKSISKSNNKKVLKILSVPFPFLKTVSKMCEGVESVFVSAQNLSSYSEGAYTGEVSAKMISGSKSNPAPAGAGTPLKKLVAHIGVLVPAEETLNLASRRTQQTG